MKWIVTTNESSLGDPKFFQQLQVAVISAKLNTVLEPLLVYDGGVVPQLQWLQEQGVRILDFKLSFAESIRSYLAEQGKLDLVKVRTGAFLKTEIPTALAQHRIDDEFVLYTDCDVIFVRDPDLAHRRTRFLSAHGSREGGRTRLRIGGWWHFNTGVILMNTLKLRAEAERFRSFVLSNGDGVKRPPSKFMNKHLFLSDQVAINLFYKGRIDKLPHEYNWNPTRGFNEAASIIHFNGLKWTQWDEFLHGELPPHRMQKFERQVKASGPAYEKYVGIAREYLGQAQPATIRSAKPEATRCSSS